jgi:hypothetical protein
MFERNCAATSVAALTLARLQVYSLRRGVNADSPPSSRRLASKFCFYSLSTE